MDVPPVHPIDPKLTLLQKRLAEMTLSATNSDII